MPPMTDILCKYLAWGKRAGWPGDIIVWHVYPRPAALGAGRVVAEIAPPLLCIRTVRAFIPLSKPGSPWRLKMWRSPLGSALEASSPPKLTKV